MEPKRDDPKYIIIENFKDFELRECIAAELAIRNENVKKLIAEIKVIDNRFYKVNSSKLEEINSKYSKNIINTYKTLIKETGFLEKQFINKYEKINDTNKLMSLYFEKFNYLKNEYFVNYETINSDPISRHPVTASKFNKNLESINFDKDLNFKSITTREGLELDKNLFPKYSRGLLEVPKKYDFTFDITIKTYLPENELNEQISKLVKDIYSEKYIKTPLELYNETFFEFSDIKYPKKIRGVKLADWFFIYDYYRYKKLEDISLRDEDIYKEIDGLLLDYDENNCNNIYSSNSKYKAEKKKLVNLIENCGYKNLLIGLIKN